MLKLEINTYFSPEPPSSISHFTFFLNHTRIETKLTIVNFLADLFPLYTSFFLSFSLFHYYDSISRYQDIYTSFLLCSKQLQLHQYSQHTKTSKQPTSFLSLAISFFLLSVKYLSFDFL